MRLIRIYEKVLTLLSWHCTVLMRLSLSIGKSYVSNGVMVDGADVIVVSGASASCGAIMDVPVPFAVSKY